MSNPDEETKTVPGYFELYGGWKSIRESKYARWSLVASLVVSPLWFAPGWWDIVFAISPSLAGFALGTFALLMGVGDERFRRLLGGTRNGKPSPLMRTSATFTHFIVVQCLALGYAILARAYYFEAPGWLLERAPWWPDLQKLAWILWALGIWLFTYSVSLTVASALALFTYVGWFDRFVPLSGEPDNEDANPTGPGSESN
jgi:hypothetical protein